MAMIKRGQRWQGISLCAIAGLLLSRKRWSGWWRIICVFIFSPIHRKRMRRNGYASSQETMYSLLLKRWRRAFSISKTFARRTSLAVDDLFPRQKVTKHSGTIWQSSRGVCLLPARSCIIRRMYPLFLLRMSQRV